jgi:ATP synthase protein I
MMDDFGLSIRRVIQFTLYFLSICLLGYAFTEYKSQFLGLVLGASISLFNSIYTARKIVRLGEMAASGEKKAISMGAPVRFASAVLAAVIALRFPQTFAFLFTVMGLFVSQAIAFIDGVYLHIKSTRR